MKNLDILIIQVIMNLIIYQICFIVIKFYYNYIILVLYKLILKALIN
jgi:hypothetical protein